MRGILAGSLRGRARDPGGRSEQVRAEPSSCAARAELLCAEPSFPSSSCLGLVVSSEQETNGSHSCSAVLRGSVHPGPFWC